MTTRAKDSSGLSVVETLTQFRLEILQTYVPEHADILRWADPHAGITTE